MMIRMSSAYTNQLPDINDPVAIANYFWQLVGSTEPFPRRLEGSIAISLPVTIVSLPSLTVAKIEVWLRERQVQCPINVSDRTLSACVIAQGGHGIIFVDGSDSVDERRFSIAHDAGHFLADYWLPRIAALKKLGEGIRPVLDGFRPPTTDERIGGLIVGLPLPTFSSIMERDEEGLANTRDAIVREDVADQVALELLAPRRNLDQLLKKSRISWDSGGAVQQASDLLAVAYGIPTRVARRLAERCVMKTRSSRSVREILGM